MSSNKLPIVAVVGRANVGKSSLFNRLINQKRAIVADVPGTTRDRVLGKAKFGDKQAWVVDTAGLKSPDDELELSIQEQIEQATESADVIVVVAEATVDITDEDRRVAKKALKTGKPVVLCVNKVDKAKRRDLSGYNRLGIKEIVETSAEHKTGLDELEGMLAAYLPKKKVKETEVLKIALLGRPNVGKSLMFNQLTSEKRAVVSDVAGTTRDVNRKNIVVDGKEIEILDTAGIRRSGKAAKGIEYYSSLRTIAAIEESDVCVLLLDATEPGTKLDQKIAGMVKESGRGLIIALNKWDLIEKDDKTFDKFSARIRYEFQFVNWAALVPTSAEDGKNIHRIIGIAQDIQEQRIREIKTSELNKWLSTTTSHHPPAGLKNTHPKLKYMTQVGTEPPTFKVFGHDTKTLHWSYKRYMERELREAFEFHGTGLKLLFSDGEEK